MTTADHLKKFGNNMLYNVFLIVTLALTVQPVFADVLLPAFPGAEGAAKYTPGGRGGDVYHVTNTNPSGQGSLAHGIETADGPRTIVFDVGGVIHFEEALELQGEKRLTIAGQTAPGDGITLRFDQGGLYIRDSQDIIVTHLRIVNGSEDDDDDNVSDLLRTDRSSNVMLSHLTIRWGSRGNFISRSNGPVTAQYLINAEPTMRNLAGWFGQMREEDGLYNQTVHKNLGIHQGGRLNMFQRGRFEFINNVTFNGRSRRPDLGPYYIMSRPWHGTGESDLGPQIFDANVIGNVMIDGENPPAATFGFGRASRVHIDGNVRDRHPEAPFSPGSADDDIYDGDVPGAFGGREGHRGDQFARVNLPLDLRLSESQWTRPVSARQAYIDVLSRSGASVARDSHDHRYVRDVMNKNTRQLPQTLSDLPEQPFPEFDQGTPHASTARDGIPDTWKIERGLDPDLAYHQQYTYEGYTYLEKYLHWRMRHSLPPDPLETRQIVVSSTDGDGGHAIVHSSVQPHDADGSSFTVRNTDEILQFGLLRFDLTKVEPGMLNDATLELAPRDYDIADDFRIKVYGLDHDRSGQRWSGGHITPDAAPAITNADNSAQMIRDDVILLGELEITNGVAKLTNPNLAVFLNLAMYYSDHPENELVTLVLKPMNQGEASFLTTSTANTFVPRLILDAVPGGN